MSYATAVATLNCTELYHRGFIAALGGDFEAVGTTEVFKSAQLSGHPLSPLLWGKLKTELRTIAEAIGVSPPSWVGGVPMASKTTAPSGPLVEGDLGGPVVHEFSTVIDQCSTQ